MKKGFTLIELMIVVVIIGILAAIAIPKFSSVKDQAEQVACRSNLRSLGSAEAMYLGTNGVYGTVAQLDASSIMGNAQEIRCPENTANAYVAVPAAPTDVYAIPCPNEAAVPVSHGSIDDGIVSWQ